MAEYQYVCMYVVDQDGQGSALARMNVCAVPPVGDVLRLRDNGNLANYRVTEVIWSYNDIAHGSAFSARATVLVRKDENQLCPTCGRGVPHDPI